MTEDNIVPEETEGTVPVYTGESTKPVNPYNLGRNIVEFTVKCSCCNRKEKLTVELIPREMIKTVFHTCPICGTQKRITASRDMPAEK